MSRASNLAGFSTSIQSVAPNNLVVGVITASSGFVGNLTGTATTSTTSGTSGYASTSGVSTSVIGGISSVTQLSVSGISTFSGITTHTTSLFGTQASFSGVVTASSFIGNLTGNVTGTATGLSGNPNITVTNATINGTLSVGGTSVILNAATLQINDKDIVVGYTTNASNSDVSTDTTANHGGIAVASTEGSPILNIPLQVGINSTPTTYKQFMWIKQGNYSGMGTDAWVSNYAISVGNTSSVQNNSRLTVGTGFTVFDAYLDASSIDIRTKNINVSGIGTIADTRFQSVGERTTIINGNTASLVYNTGGGNIAICTNPNADITLAVTGIPTDTSFNNTAISFSVFINQTGTARSCTAVTLNGYSATIRWSGGSLASAVTGVTTTNGMDIYSFTGINTVSSASTTANYYVLGVVNGGYK